MKIRTRWSTLFLMILGMVFIVFQKAALGGYGKNEEEEAVLWRRADELSGKGDERTLTIGELPVSYDHRLLLRKGRRIPIELSYVILTSQHPGSANENAVVVESVYDDTGQFELLTDRTAFHVLYNIQETQNKLLKIQIIPTDMSFSLFSTSVEFVNPLRYWTLDEKNEANKRTFGFLNQLSNEEREKEELRMWPQYLSAFLASPVFSGQLILKIGHNDDCIRWGIPEEIRYKYASVDFEVEIEPGYRTELVVEQDILFSDYAR